jgi:hypothetical protein
VLDFEGTVIGMVILMSRISALSMKKLTRKTIQICRVNESLNNLLMSLVLNFMSI